MILAGWILVFSVKSGLTHEPHLVGGYTTEQACIEAAHRLDGNLYTASCIPGGDVRPEQPK